MNFAKHVAEYLQVRRGLGFKLVNHEFQLRSFVKYLEEVGADHINTEIAFAWAMGDGHRHPGTAAQRLTTVRHFARYLAGVDPKTEIPPRGLLPTRFPRVHPYIYSDAEVRALMKAALELASPGSIRGPSYSTFLGLLATTGLRLSEGLELLVEDVDLNNGILEVRQSKCRKSRFVPVQASTIDALRTYERTKAQHQPKTACPYFFVDQDGGPIPGWRIRYHFVRLCVKVGLRKTISGGPRMHDFRHTFAVKTLIRWYETGVDVDQRMPRLSTYLGHVHIADTYWDISAHPELLRLAASRLEKTIEGLL